jgi:hypothetical protein
MPCSQVRGKVSGHVPEDNVSRGKFVVQVFWPFPNHWRYSEQRGKNSGTPESVWGTLLTMKDFTADERIKKYLRAILNIDKKSRQETTVAFRKIPVIVRLSDSSHVLVPSTCDIDGSAQRGKEQIAYAFWMWVSALRNAEGAGRSEDLPNPDGRQMIRLRT